MDSQHRTLFEKTISKLLDYSDKDCNQLSEYLPPSDLSSNLSLKIGDVGIEENEFLSLIDDYLKYAVNTASPQFTNQLWSGRNTPALLGEMLTAFTNASVYTYETAPVATLIEIEMIRLMGQYVGFEDCDGTFVTGGSNANLLALTVARNTMFPEIKSKGVASAGQLTLFVSGDSHYSFEKAVNVLGLGLDNLIKVKADEITGKMIVSELENEIQLSLNRGEKPFFIGATLGSTELGAFDDLIELHRIAEKYNMWLHGDAAWGGGALLSTKYRSLLNGSELCDSFAWDAHKLMGIPLICSIVLFRNRNKLYQAVATDNASYIFHEHNYQEYDLGRKSLQCGRRIDALKLWLAWKYYGKNGYAKRIERCFELADYTEQKIKESENLELLKERDFLNINFRFRCNEIDNTDKINLTIRENLRIANKTLTNYCYVSYNGARVLSIRYVISNPDMSESDIDKFLQMIVDEGFKLTKKN